MRPARRLTATTITIGLAAAGAAIDAGPAVSAPRAAPACTPTALVAGLHRGPRSVRQGRIDRTAFACAKGYAYAGVIVGGRAHGVEVTILFRALDGRWTVTPRSTPCRRHLVPKSIHRGACESN